MEQCIDVQENGMGEFVMSAIASACNFERSTITPDTSLQDLGVDSLSMTAVVAKLESAYECELTLEQMLDLFNAERVRDLIELASRYTTHSI